MAVTPLHETDERRRLLLDGARDYAILMLDLNGNIQSWSDNAERMKGYTEAEILGRSYATFFTPRDTALGEPQRILALAAQTGRAETEGLRIRKDGSQFWAHGVLTALYDDHGAATGFVKVTQDITERRRVETTLHNVLEAAPDAIVGVDSQGRIALVNRRTEELFGYRRSELLGEQVERLVPEQTQGAHISLRSDYHRNPSGRSMGAGRDLHARRQDGSLLPVEVRLSTLDTEDGVIVIAAVRDISERKTAQRAIEQLNADLLGLNQELEQRVERRTAQLQLQAEQLRLQAEQLQEANAELESFSYSVSHDLRAPLRAITGFARILSSRYQEDLDDSGRRYLAKIDNGSVRMGILIDGLLAFSRLQRLIPVSRSLDLSQMAKEIWEDLIEQKTDRRIEFSCGQLPLACGDPRLIRHVLTNLLDNAVKYTREQDPARVEVGHRINPDGQVAYLVRDNGTGFDMAYADKLFQVFQRLHLAENYEGNGIGLALASRIIHRHGGEIWADATPGHGATFYFTLPDLPAGQDMP